MTRLRASLFSVLLAASQLLMVVLGRRWDP